MGGPPPPEPDPPEPEPEFALSDEAKAAMEDISAEKDGSLLKKVLTAGDGSGSKPETGVNVKCHYTGRLLDGAKFDSSKDRGKEFGFKIGSGVIKGWSEGVATMEVGETAQFCIAAEKAYGESGSPPVIPPNASLQFEIELVSFSEYEDVASTGGKVQKKVLAEGEGYKRPKDADICMLKMKLCLEDGTEVLTVGGDEPAEYVTSSGKAPGIAAALKDMKKGAKVELVIQPEMGYGEDGCAAGCAEGCAAVPANAVLKAEVELTDFVEVTDVSKDGGVMAKILSEGEGWKKPKDNDIVQLKYKITLEDGTVVKDSGDEPATHTLGDGTLVSGIVSRHAWLSVPALLAP